MFLLDRMLSVMDHFCKLISIEAKWKSEACWVVVFQTAGDCSVWVLSEEGAAAVLQRHHCTSEKEDGETFGRGQGKPAETLFYSTFYFIYFCLSRLWVCLHSTNSQNKSKTDFSKSSPSQICLWGLYSLYNVQHRLSLYHVKLPKKPLIGKDRRKLRKPSPLVLIFWN